MPELTIFEKVEQKLIKDTELVGSGNRPIYHNQNIAEALIETDGHISNAAKILGTSYNRLYYHIKNSDELQELLDALREAHGISLAELAIRNLKDELEDKQSWATAYVLNKSKWGQALGFGDRLDITASAKPPEIIEVVRDQKQLGDMVKEITEDNKSDESDIG